MTEPTEEEVKEGVPVHEVSRLRFTCPHCGSHMKVRTSKTHLPEYRQIYLNCTNQFVCGYRGRYGVIAEETLVPSYCPKPGINIKLSKWFKRQSELEDEGQMRLGIESQTKKKEPKR